MSTGTVTLKKTVYETNCERKQTEPRPERNGTLFLKITVGANFARIDCREMENVGEGKNRKVIFSSDKPCKLIFDNKVGDPVFGTKEREIPQGETSLPIGDTVVGWTHCSVDPLDPSKEIPREFQCPPKIEVP